MKENAAWIEELSGELAGGVPGVTEGMRADLARNFKVFAREGGAFQLAGQVEAIFRSETC